MPPLSSQCMLTMGLLWQGHAPVSMLRGCFGWVPSLPSLVNNGAFDGRPSLPCTNSWFQPIPHSSPFRLSSCSQSMSSPQFCSLKPKFQHPAPPHIPTQDTVKLLTYQTKMQLRISGWSVQQGGMDPLCQSLRVLLATNQSLHSLLNF